MKVDFRAESPEDSIKLAKILSENINKPALILLQGEMGTGKTFLVKEFTKATGSNAYTSSPTFSLINLYETPKGKIYHLDLYRLNDFDELYSIGFDDILNEDAIIFIEWPDIADLKEADYVINIKDLGNNKRDYKIGSNKQNLDYLEDLINGE